MGKMEASSGQKKDGNEEKGDLEEIKTHAHDMEEKCTIAGNKSYGHGTATSPPEKIEDAPDVGTPIATEQIAKCANDVTGSRATNEASSTTTPNPRGIFKVNRTDQGGQLDEVNERLDNLETATSGGDILEATEVNDVEVLEYAEAVPIEDATDAQAEIESLSHRNMRLKHLLVILLIMTTYSVVCWTFYLLGVFGRP